MPEEIRLAARDLAKIAQFQNRLAGLSTKFDAQSIARLGTDIAGKINSVAKQLLGELDEVKRQLGVTEPGTARELRRTLETVEGGTGALKAALPLIALMPQAARLGPVPLQLIAAAAAVAGGSLEGSTREDLRREQARARAIEADVGYQARKELFSIEQEIKRREQARRAARGIR